MSVSVACIDYASKKESTVTSEASYRQSIVTTYRGPTHTKGSRFIAKCDAMKITVPFDYALNASENHAAAAAELAAKLGWSGRLIGGQCDESSMCFVFVE